MTVAPAVGLPWFKAPFGVDFLTWPKAARRLWEFLRQPQFQGADRFRFKDWELAKALDVKRRVIQKGLKILEDLGVIVRSWIWGHDGGRVIEITLKLAGPKPSEPAKPKPTPRDKSPHPISAVPPTPEQLAAAARANQPKPEPPPTPAQEEAARYWLERGKKLREQRAAEEAREAARRANPTPKRTPEEVRSQLDALKARRPSPIDPRPDPPDGRPPDPGG